MRNMRSGSVVKVLTKAEKSTITNLMDTSKIDVCDFKTMRDVCKL